MATASAGGAPLAAVSRASVHGEVWRGDLHVRRAITLSAFALVLAGLPALGASMSAPTAGAAGGSRQIPASGTGRLVPVAPGSGALQYPEFVGEAEDGDAGPPAGTGPNVDRSSSQAGHGA